MLVTKESVFKMTKLPPFPIMKLDRERLDFACDKHRGMNDIEAFIHNFMTPQYGTLSPYQCNNILEDHFSNGYCWHFANILNALWPKRGYVCIAAPMSHVVWVCDGIPYDCTGVYTGEAEYFIPDYFCEMFKQYTGIEPMLSFKHIADDNKTAMNQSDCIQLMKDWCEFAHLDYDSSVEELLK